MIKAMNHEDILKLSYMRYKSGYYTAEEWRQKTGILPCESIFYIAPHTKLVCWTKQAEEIYLANSNQIRCNWMALGVEVQ